ncbi:hypothetical protein QYE76_044327 [Lolium multiflorum]|uniref:DUF4218 domain-containing protein n=1 Tax=Lolium multiflorum TaxID=4521 RepID=A0AAD8WWY8_LOLMU|nr:hypothetical protein QYE76_044327 [Lolium multiflorum]
MVTDYPGYAYVSAQVGHGFNGCVKCMDETPHLQLPRDPGSSKPCTQVLEGGFAWITRGENAVICSMKSPRMDRKQDTILNILASGKIFKPRYDYDDDDDDDRRKGLNVSAKGLRRTRCFPLLLHNESEELEQFFRYLDVAKKRFTGMKSHDCHVLMTQILPVAIRGIMDEHVRDTVWPLQLFDVITRKSIGVRQLKMLQDEIVVILCELEIYFPPAFCDICVHLLLHVVEDIKQLGPTFLHNMMPFERQNGVMKGYVRNRARPDASMAKGFLTYECISFCQNYLSTKDDEDHVGLPPGRTSGGSLESVTARATAQSMSALTIDATTLTGLTGSRYNT